MIVSRHYPYKTPYNVCIPDELSFISISEKGSVIALRANSSSKLFSHVINFPTSPSLPPSHSVPIMDISLANMIFVPCVIKKSVTREQPKIKHRELTILFLNVFYSFSSICTPLRTSPEHVVKSTLGSWDILGRLVISISAKKQNITIVSTSKKHVLLINVL